MATSSPAAHAAYCRRMAMQTYALADAAEDLDMIRAYVDIATRWFRRAERAWACPADGGDHAAQADASDAGTLDVVPTARGAVTTTDRRPPVQFATAA